MSLYLAKKFPFNIKLNLAENLRNLENPYFNQVHDYRRATFQEMREPSNTSEKRMSISACNPDAIKVLMRNNFI